MNKLNLTLTDGRTQHLPGEALEATASWQCAETPRSVEARLFWFTRGAGDENVEIVETISLDKPHANDQRTINFRLPEAPYSFTGKLITLIWAVELVAKPGDETARAEFTMSPTGEAVDLTAPPAKV